MRNTLLLFIVFSFYMQFGFSQVVSPFVIDAYGKVLMPEHGFLPGSKFPIYPIKKPVNFNSQSIRVELVDNRNNLNLMEIECSSLSITNKSEFNSPQTIYKIKDYIDKLFADANLKIDSTATHKIEISLEAIDSRLIGFGSIRVHGLCQLKMKYNTFEKVYCCDIKDGDPDSPLKPSSFATRKTASRFMVSASIRECFRDFLIDLERELPH